MMVCRPSANMAATTTTTTVRCSSGWMLLTSDCTRMPRRAWNAQHPMILRAHKAPATSELASGGEGERAKRRRGQRQRRRT